MIEALVAITIFSLGLATATFLLMMNQRTLLASENYVVATQLADEALQGVRQIRDSSLLYCPGGAAQFWRDLTRVADSTCSNAAAMVDLAGGAFFAVEPDSTASATPGTWRLHSQTNNLTGTALDPDNTTYRLCRNNTTMEYRYDAACATGTPTVFRRYVQVGYCDAALSCGSTTPTDIMQVKAVVLFGPSGDLARDKVEMTTYLHRYARTAR